MAFEELKEDVNHLQEEMKAYIESSTAYYKLWGFKVAVKTASLLAKAAIVVLFLFMVILFVSLAMAILLGEWLDSYVWGFLSVGLFYLILSLIVMAFREQLVSRTLLIRFSDIFFND